MPILLPSFIRSLIPSNSNPQNHASGSTSHQDSDIIPPGTVTIQQQTFNGQEQIPTTVTEPLNMEQPITELSMKPLNAEQPKTEEPFPPVVAQPMEIIPAADASTAPAPAAEGTGTEKGMKRSQSKRLSKNPAGPGASKKNSTEAYNAFWRKLIGITPKGGDKGKGKGRGGEGDVGKEFEDKYL